MTVFLTSWQNFLTSWWTFSSWRILLRYDELFDFMTHFLTSGQSLDVFLTPWQTLWRHDMFLMSWLMFWLHDKPFDEICVMTHFLTLWRVLWRHDKVFDVMAYFYAFGVLTYFWHHDKHFVVPRYFFHHFGNKTSWKRVFDVISNFFYFPTYFQLHGELLTYVLRHDKTFWRHDVFLM